MKEVFKLLYLSLLTSSDEIKDFSFQVFGPVLSQAWKLKDSIKDIGISCQIPKMTMDEISKEQAPKVKQFTRSITSSKKRKQRRNGINQQCPGVPTSSQLNEENKFFSVRSSLCKSDAIKKTFTEIQENTGVNITFSHLKSTFGADWEMDANVAGLTAPNGRHFCPFCEIMLSNVSKGVLHSPVLFPKYANGGQISPTSFECRTLDSMSKSASEFQQSCAQKENAKHYKNCEHIPLIPEKDLLIKHVSVMLLHLSLGVGLQFINIVENAAVSLDVEIREANGLTSDGVIESYNKQHLLEEEIMAATVQADEISE